MKLKFKLMTVFAALGVASSGFAAWNFATATSGEASIPVGIEAAVGSIGTIDFDKIGTYNLADTPNPLVFKGKFNPASGINLAEVNLTYKVTLNSTLADLIDFGSASEGVWVSDVATSITPTWNPGKNPGDLAAYNAIKANLANLSMNVTLTASKKDGVEPIAPIEIVPGTLPAGLVVGEGGLIQFDKDLGPVQLVVQGIDEHGNTSGVAQDFVWSSTEPTRASVVDGLVTPLADGNVTITATAATLGGKGLKKAEGSAASYDFNFNITGFTVIPPEPVPTSLKLVLPEGIENNHEMKIGDTLNVSAVVLDEEGNIMPKLIVESELLDDVSASYIGGVLTALAAIEENTLLFSYEGLKDVYFDFSVAAAPITNLVDHIEINGNEPLTVEIDAIGKLDIKVYDASNNVLSDETVTLASNNEKVFIVEPDGSYLAGDAGTALVTATSTSKPEVSGSLSVTVEPKPIQYHTVIIKYHNGAEDNQLQVAHNDSIAKPVDPTREGYAFAGWTKDGEAYDFGDAVVGGFILNATWTQNTYTVIFDTDGGNIIANQTIAHGDLVEEVIPTKDGSTFAGWFLGENLYDFETPVTSNFTLTAHWNVIQYTITFNTGEGGTAIPNETINHGDRFTQPANPTREGYTFEGWLHEGVPFKFTDAVTGDVNLVADWKEIGGGGEVTIQSAVALTFPDDNSANNKVGSYTDTKTYKIGSYEWSISNFNNNNWSWAFIRAGSKSFSSVATISTSKEIPEPISKIEVTVDSVTATNVNSTKLIVASNSEFTSNVTTINGPTVAAGKMEYSIAYPVANYFYKLEYDLKMGSANGFLQISKVDYLYENEGGGTVTPVTEYNVHFNSDGGTSVASQKVAEGGKVTKPVDPTYEGKEFVKWLDNGVEYDFNTPVTSELNLVAEWRDVGGGTVVETDDITVPLSGKVLENSEKYVTTESTYTDPNSKVSLKWNNLNPNNGQIRGNQTTQTNLQSGGNFYIRNSTPFAGNVRSVTISNITSAASTFVPSSIFVATSASQITNQSKGASIAGTSGTNSVTWNFAGESGSYFALGLEKGGTSGTATATSIVVTYEIAGGEIAEFGVLNSIEIDTPANKTTFNTGETFSSAGLTLIAKDDSSPAIPKMIDKGFSTDKDDVTFDESHVGEQTVIVSYTEGSVTKQTSYTIQVIDIATLKTFSQITSEEDLHIGATYVIGGVKGEETWAMTTTQNPNNRGAQLATMSGENILESETVQKFELVKGTIDGTYAFKIIGGDNDGDYIYASGTGNHLRTESELSAKSCWSITFTDGVISIVSQGADIEQIYLRFNEGTEVNDPLFSCYTAESSVMTPVVLYLDTSYSG